MSGPGRRYSPRPGLWGSVPRAPALAEPGRSRAYSPRQLQQQAREADAPRAARPQHGRDLRQLERRAHAQRAPVAEPQQRLHGARVAGIPGVPPVRPPGEGSDSALGRRVHRSGPSAFPGPRPRGRPVEVRPVEVRPSAPQPPISALRPAQGLRLPRLCSLRPRLLPTPPPARPHPGPAPPGGLASWGLTVGVRSSALPLVRAPPRPAGPSPGPVPPPPGPPRALCMLCARC